MKKLLFITWSISYGYGTEKSLADILNRMSEDYEIEILPLFKNSNNRIFNEKIKILESLIDYTKEDFNQEKALDNYYKLLANPVLFNKRINEKYDCIIACNHNAPSYFASYIENTPKIVWIRGDMSELDYKKYNPISVEYTQLKNEHEMQYNVFKKFDKIVVISKAVKQMLDEMFGINENIVEISNSIDKEKIIKLSKKEVELPQRPIFLNIGRLDYNKNQILLLKAAKQLKNFRDDFLIYLLGDGEERQKLQDYIDKNDLNKNIEILGFKENPYKYIKHAVATVTTSFSEGFGLVLAESVILNTPIISTNVGIASELIEKYNCGSIIDYNEKELSEILLKYLKDYDKNLENNIFDIGAEYELETELTETKKIINQTISNGIKKSKFTKLPYPVAHIDYKELDSYKVEKDKMYILEVKKEEVKYEYLINWRQSSNKLIVFNNGAIEGGNVRFPIFQRHSWANDVKTSSIFCMDPTLYVNDLSVGWGIGKNDNYYLENSSFILKRLIQKMNIKLEDTVIYGTSAGGYLSIMMGIYLKGTKVVADNSQLELSDWVCKPAFDTVILYCFDNVSDSIKYTERYSVIESFKKHSYVPKIYLHVNVCSKADNSTQVVPFLKTLENVEDIKEYNDIEIITHYEPTKGHNGLNKDDAIEFLYKVLKI